MRALILFAAVALAACGDGLSADVSAWCADHPAYVAVAGAAAGVEPPDDFDPSANVAWKVARGLGVTDQWWSSLTAGDIDRLVVAWKDAGRYGAACRAAWDRH